MTNEELFQAAEDIDEWWDENIFPTIGRCQYLETILAFKVWVRDHPDQTIEQAAESFLTSEEVPDLWTYERVPKEVVEAVVKDLLVGKSS